jgi:hypothetical protein
VGALPLDRVGAAFARAAGGPWSARLCNATAWVVVEQAGIPLPVAPLLLKLRRLGIARVHPLADGFAGWRAHGFPLEPLPPAIPVR